MKIIVPIASQDQDILKTFRKIKPLVQLGDKTMIETFIENFDLDYEFIFLCRQKDLIETDLLTILEKQKIKKKIVAIQKNTSNVIETINFANKHVNYKESALICHQDCISTFLSKKDLLQNLNKPDLDGLLFASDSDRQTNTTEIHTGRVIIKDNEVIEVQEKAIKTENSKILTGIYYFSKWADYLKYSKKTFENQSPILGRYFVSQVYNEYLREKKNIKIYYVKKHISFGLVPYIQEYNFWFKYLKKNIKKKLKFQFDFLNLIPSCGDGLRFLENKKNNFKPLISVGHHYMIEKTIKSLPVSKKNVVIMRNDHNKNYEFKNKIKKRIKNLDVMILKNKTSGMATTCYEYLKNYKKQNPILISSCDYSVIFDEQKLKKIIKYFDPDVIVWTFKNYPDARIAPFAYAYCNIKDGKIHNISEKTPISNSPNLDHIAQGIFYFKSKDIFMKAFKKMIKKKNKINNEYYVGNSINELIKENYTVIPFEVEQYICLGTIKDLNVYIFWSNFFNDKI